MVFAALAQHGACAFFSSDDLDDLGFPEVPVVGGMRNVYIYIYLYIYIYIYIYIHMLYTNTYFWCVA
jgi:hypothetical protein